MYQYMYFLEQITTVINDTCEPTQAPYLKIYLDDDEITTAFILTQGSISYETASASKCYYLVDSLLA